MSGKFKGKALAVILVTVMLSISVSPMIFDNQMGEPQSQSEYKYPSTIFGSLQQYAEKQGTTVEELTANWTADDWLRWYKYEGNPSWGSTNITDQFLATDWVKLPNSGNLTWGADYDYEYKYNSTSDQLEMWHNGTLVSYLGSDDLWHYASDRPNLTDLHHITDKEYVDNAVTSLGARYYMIDTSSGISDYKLTQLSPPSGSEQSVTKTGLADDDYIAGWISPDTSLSKLIKGVYNWYIYAEKTGGTQTLRLYWKLVERKSDDTETVIATSAVSNEISTSKSSYIIPLTLNEDYALDDGSYVVGKLYADVSDGGSAPDIAIYYDGSSKSHWEIPTNLEIFSDQFLKLDGSNANSDIDITPYNLTVNNISAFNLKLLASYIIWTDGTNYYATNGTSGLIDNQSTNASAVINYAINNTGYGGLALLMSGVYDIDYPIHLKGGVWLRGSGIGSYPRNQYSTVLRLTADVPAIEVGVAGDNQYFSKISDMNIYGNGRSAVSGVYGIHYKSECSDATVENVFIEQVNYGIYMEYGWFLRVVNSWIESNEYGIYTDCKKNWILGSVVASNGAYGIYIDTGADEIIMSSLQMKENHNDITVKSSSETNIILGDTIAVDADVRNIYIDARDGADVNMVISNCEFGNVNKADQDYIIGTVMYSGAKATLYFSNCIMHDVSTEKIHQTLQTGGHNATISIKHSIGYTTENSGSSEITGDGTNTSFSISFPTSFGATPSIVLVTPTNSSMASATWWVSAKTSTYFNITFSTAPSNNTKLSFDWYAEV